MCQERTGIKFRHPAVIALSLFVIALASLAAVHTQATFAAAPPVEASLPASPLSPAQPDVTTTPVCGLGWNTTLDNSSGDLYSISAISPNDVWAVGSNQGSSGVAMHWDGQSWNVVATPAFTATTELVSVAAISANNVWAVGYTGGYALILHWNGTAWSVMPGAAALYGGVLQGIDALSANDIWAVGWRSASGGTAQTLIEHWDGTNWTVVPSPNVAQHHMLWGVSARASNDVWTVGFSDSNTTPEQTLIEHWDGTQWSVVPSPNVTGPGDNSLWGVTTISANNVWAVGVYSYSATQTAQAVTLHWDGVQWSAVANPANTNPSSLFGIEAISANDIWAVGITSGSAGCSLTMHWNGTAWSIVPTSGNFRLVGISALSTGDIWTAGQSRFAMRYFDPCTPTRLLTAHATWQGPPSQPDTRQGLPITLTLKLGTTETDYLARITDPSGYFTVSVGSLPNGTYNWRAKGPKYLANSGIITLTGTQTISLNVGLMRVGDCNDDNSINIADFNIERIAFGKGLGESGYDARADFDGNNYVTVADFNLLKGNFGRGGAPPLSSGNP